MHEHPSTGTARGVSLRDREPGNGRPSLGQASGQASDLVKRANGLASDLAQVAARVAGPCIEKANADERAPAPSALVPLLSEHLRDLGEALDRIEATLTYLNGAL